MFAVLTALLLLAQVSPPSQADLQGLARVIDGDTIEMEGLTVRLDGIDAPELEQTCLHEGRVWACGKAAADALRTLTQGRRVECWIKDTDPYGRFLAHCIATGKDIGGRMVELGWALAHYLFSYEYSRAEHHAKSARLGIWASEFETPWEWRKRLHNVE